MKFLRFFFSKIMLIGLMALLQIGIFVMLIMYFSQFAVIYEAIRLIVFVLMFSHIANKHQGEEFKLPWLITLFLFPIPVTIVYLIFAEPKLSKKSKRVKDVIIGEIAKYNEDYSTKKQEVSDYLKDYVGIENYLVKQCTTTGHLNNKIDYYPLGEDFYSALISDLKNAEKFIFMEYFIIEEGVFWNSILDVLKEKVSSGVEVRVLYDDVGCATKLKIRYAKKLRKLGIETYKFSPFTANFSNMFNNRDHRKITVIDGTIGYTGGVNLADEYINHTHPFGHWKDTAVRIEGSAVKNLTSIFLSVFDITAKKQFVDYSKYFNVEYPVFPDGGYVHPFGTGPIPIYTEQVAQNNFLNMISSAKKSVYITTPYLIINHAFINALRTASERGIDVRIVTPHIPDKKLVFSMTRSTYFELMPAGVKIYEYTPGFIHAKQMLIDGKFAFVGTVNCDYRSLAHHYECGAVICDKTCCKDIANDFKQLFNVSEQINNESFKFNGFTKLMMTLLSIFRPIF